MVRQSWVRHCHTLSLPHMHQCIKCQPSPSHSMHWCILWFFHNSETLAQIRKLSTVLKTWEWKLSNDEGIVKKSIIGKAHHPFENTPWKVVPSPSHVCTGALVPYPLPPTYAPVHMTCSLWTTITLWVFVQFRWNFVSELHLLWSFSVQNFRQIAKELPELWDQTSHMHRCICGRERDIESIGTTHNAKRSLN